VPDGSRRLVLAYTDDHPDSREFQAAAAQIPAQYLHQAIQIFFEYGLPILLVPILGRSILKRGEQYLRLTVREGLRLLFNSPAWLDLYERMDICVRVHGDITCLRGTPAEEAIGWIEQVCRTTAGHRSHRLHYAIGESPVVGEQMLGGSIRFFQQHGRIPTREEQVLAYYGADLPPLDFFIMTSKMSGMGALPNLLVDGDTEMYFLPTVMGLTERNYRLILYDMLYGRSPLRGGIHAFDSQPSSRLALRQAYEHSIDKVVGIGFDVGNVWVMQDGADPLSEGK
jgi:hypothetical protein